MSKRSERYDGESLETVADWMAQSGAGSSNDQSARAEFLLRQTKFLQRSAEAAEKTAKATTQYTRYMFWSVLVLTLSFLASLILQIIVMYS